MNLDETTASQCHRAPGIRVRLKSCKAGTLEDTKFCNGAFICYIGNIDTMEEKECPALEKHYAY
jgi:hypothetical protein